MKRKEREHLKEDPFVDFIGKIIEVFNKSKKWVLLGGGALIVIVLVIVIFVFIRSKSISNENNLYARAFSVKSSDTLSSGEKLTELKKLKPKRGISSVIDLFIASIYFEEGEMKTARQVIDESSKSKVKLVNDEKILLKAEILNGMNKHKEAINLFNKLLTDRDLEISKDFILLKVAKIQLKMGHKKLAISNLKNLTNDFPESFYYDDAISLLGEIESN